MPMSLRMNCIGRTGTQSKAFQHAGCPNNSFVSEYRLIIDRIPMCTVRTHDGKRLEICDVGIVLNAALLKIRKANAESIGLGRCDRKVKARL
jgi:hypothetical protein